MEDETMARITRDLRSDSGRPIYDFAMYTWVCHGGKIVFCFVFVAILLLGAIAFF